MVNNHLRTVRVQIKLSTMVRSTPQLSQVLIQKVLKTCLIAGIGSRSAT